MRYIGDVHGDYGLYCAAVEGALETIQVGDFGIGFGAEAWTSDPNHRFIRGNHDNPHLARKKPNHIDSGSEGDHFFVGGGWSIDHRYRTPGVSWWPEEEHLWSELDELIDEFRQVKPRVVVSHEAPRSVIEAWIGKKVYPPGPSRTSLALQEMLEIHQPELWVFGHWHQRLDRVINGTRFVCLEIGGVLDVQ